MKIRDILDTQQQLDEITLRQAAAAGMIGAAAITPLTLTQPLTTRPAVARTASVSQPQVQLPRAQRETAVARRDEFLAQQIVDKYSVDSMLAKEVVKLAHKYEHPDFPTAKDILAIVGIESSFRPTIKSQLRTDPARGLMQVRPGVWKIDPEELEDIEGNIMHGASILRRYYNKLDNKQAAVQAYNVGITDFRQGVKNPRYLSKYQKEYGRYVAGGDY